MTDDAQPADPKRKARVYTEEVKQQQVSHWDMDYLPREQIEELRDGGPAEPAER